MTFLNELNLTLKEMLETDNRVYILGEDIIDPYGGAFKVTKGLSTLFPERVIATPISEAAVIGIAGGMALAGLRPIVEIMFGDFLTLGFDQILNHLTKYSPMYNRIVNCPVIIRTPFGGGRAYGPTHSQSLEKYFLGIPEIRIVAPSLYSDIHKIFRNILSKEEVTIFCEHKLLYPQKIINMNLDDDSGNLIINSYRSKDGFETKCISFVPREECKCTVLSYGYTATIALGVIEQLAFEEEIFAELIIIESLAPYDIDIVFDSVESTKALIIAEESTSGWSWGTQIALDIYFKYSKLLRKPIEIVSSASSIIPSSKDEESKVLVNSSKIKQAILRSCL